MPDYPPLSPRVIGETESALGALLAPLLAEAGRTFLRKVEAADVSAAVSGLAAAGLLTIAGGRVALTDAGRVGYGRVRARLQDITGYLFDFPAEDLATAGSLRWWPVT